MAIAGTLETEDPSGLDPPPPPPSMPRRAERLSREATEPRLRRARSGFFRPILTVDDEKDDVAFFHRLHLHLHLRRRLHRLYEGAAVTARNQHESQRQDSARDAAPVASVRAITGQPAGPGPRAFFSHGIISLKARIGASRRNDEGGTTALREPRAYTFLLLPLSSATPLRSVLHLDLCRPSWRLVARTRRFPRRFLSHRPASFDPSVPPFVPLSLTLRAVRPHRCFRGRTGKSVSRLRRSVPRRRRTSAHFAVSGRGEVGRHRSLRERGYYVCTWLPEPSLHRLPISNESTFSRRLTLPLEHPPG